MSISILSCGKDSAGAIKARYKVEHHGEQTTVDALMELVIYSNCTQGSIEINPGEAETPDTYIDRIADHCERIAKALRERSASPLAIPIFR